MQCCLCRILFIFFYSSFCIFTILQLHNTLHEFRRLCTCTSILSSFLFLYTHTNIHSSIYKTFQHLWQLARQSGIYTRNKDNNNNNKQTNKKTIAFSEILYIIVCLKEVFYIMILHKMLAFLKVGTCII